MDRLDTFSAAVLSALGAPASTNNIAKLRTWAHFECGSSLSGRGLITCWNPWAIEGSPGGCSDSGCGWSAIAKYPSCAAGVQAAVAAFRRDVPAVVANLQADGPYSAWWSNPILCQIGYWIHGVECAAPYSGFVGFGPLAATSGSPDPQYGCATGGCSPACDSCHICVGGACQPKSCPAGTSCVNGQCLPPNPPPSVSESLLPLGLLVAVGAGAWWYARQQGGSTGSRRVATGFAPAAGRSGRPARSQRRLSGFATL